MAAVDAEGGTALMGVAFKGHLEVARYPARERGAAVDAVDAEGGTAITRQSLLASAPRATLKAGGRRGRHGEKASACRPES